MPLAFIAYWNDEAALRAGEPLPPPSAFEEREFKPVWVAVALGIWGLGGFLLYKAAKSMDAANAHEASAEADAEAESNDDDYEAAE